MGCDYLEPIKGIGPKSALKLVREHGDLGSVISYLRSKMPAPSSSAATPSPSPSPEPEPESEEDKGTDEEEMGEGERAELEAKKKKKEKAAAARKKSKGGKGKGKIVVPEDWPFEAARELFLHPDVMPAKDVEVRSEHLGVCDKALMNSRSDSQLEWTLPDVDGLVDFLVREKGFKLVDSYLFAVRAKAYGFRAALFQRGSNSKRCRHARPKLQCQATGSS